QITLGGTFAYDRDLGMDLHAAGDAVRLDEFGAIASVPFSGQGGIAATVEGPYADPTISATVELDGLTSAGYPIGDTKATLIYAQRVLRADRIAVRRGSGRLIGGGAMTFSPAGAQVETNLDLFD